MAHRFEKSDAWLLCSIAMAGEEWVTLRQVLGPADHLNVSIPTLDEVNGALKRLGAAGLVQVRERQMMVKPEVRALHDRFVALPARKIPAHSWEFLQSCSDREMANCDFEPFSKKEFDAAYQEYAQAHRSRWGGL